MAKTRQQVEEKMRERVATAGKYLKSGMESAPDPIDVLLKDPDAAAKKLEAGLREALRKGSYTAGLQRAKERNAWQNSKERAARHYEERADDMVSNAMMSYEKRMGAIDRAKARVANMPRVTTSDRIAYSAAYQKAVSEEFAKEFGRKT